MLTGWERVLMVVAGAGVVILAVVLVVCVVRPSCWLHSLLLDDEEKRRREKEKQLGRMYTAPPPSLSFTPSTKTSYDQPLPHPAVTPGQTMTETNQLVGTTPSPGPQPPLTSNETHSLLGALSSKRDSTYSSMSEYSGRTSPTNSCRSSVGDSVGSGACSPMGGEARGHLSFGLQYVVTSPEAAMGKLVITVLEARSLAGREYLGHACDPYVKVVVWRERRSLRKHKSPPLHIFRTRTVRHTQDPDFNQSFVMEAAKSDLKELVVKLVAMDCDRWASPSTVGEVTQPLRDIKNLATLTHRTTLNYFLAPPKLDIGDVLFGLSYLPTAQRLSVSVIKAQNLKYGNVVDDLKDFCPYIRVLLISGAGRVLKKKKTTWRSATACPIWNETLIFDLAQQQVEHVTFLLVVCTRPQMPVTPTHSSASSQPSDDVLATMAPQDEVGASPLLDSQARKQDRYLGKLALGCNVRGEEQRQHWMNIMAAPRKVVSQWHPLK